MKNALIKIDTNNRNDLLINWNFNGLLMPKIFRRHVFLCPSDNEEIFAATRSLLQKCYQFFKNGDLYVMATFNCSQLDWHEKCKIQNVHWPQFPAQSRYLYSASQMKGLAKILVTLCKYREPTFVTIFNDGYSNVDEIEEVISETRLKKDLTCLFMLCNSAHKENKIQFSKGICFLSAEEKQIYKLYKYYDEHLACITAEITLESQTGNIYMKGNIWASLQFSLLSRKIYYPLASNQVDVIETYRLCTNELGKENFKVGLKYKLLNGDIYTARGEIEVKLVPDAEKFSTYNKEEKNRMFNLSWGIELGENPFEKQFALKRGI